ncbi:UPF0175 family protein [Litorilinea aerophila]|uniref:UPF0175 family protein n=1 Tax=Litorilinea aerophila TaxID=1204385 RepID=A0A540V8E0_9CHLR|nr:UPF0175 family protein [Litorilinea aerophila]MCC9079041.1 UPF0175 family protein [Litorilinea aerophila]GIV79521.1 MAG: hypothetical protein KatS3mg050_3915 [Litorilinea sp.]
MTDLVSALSEDLREALRIPPEEQEARLRQELAVRLYAKGLLSLGKARQLAEMSKWDFLALLGREGIPRHYDQEELQKDLEVLETLT